jgi:hypothetical protein
MAVSVTLAAIESRSAAVPKALEASAFALISGLLRSSSGPKWNASKTWRRSSGSALASDEARSGSVSNNARLVQVDNRVLALLAVEPAVRGAGIKTTAHFLEVP